MSARKALAQPDQGVNSEAHDEINSHSQVNPVSPMAKIRRKMREKRKEVDAIADQNCRQIFKPPTETRSEEWRHFCCGSCRISGVPPITIGHAPSLVNMSAKTEEDGPIPQHAGGSLRKDEERAKHSQ